MRKLFVGSAAILGVAVAALATGFGYLRTATPDYDGEVRLSGLESEVEIWRDSLGVPHLWAQSREDLFFGMGYVHAQDRLWQMELFRRVAEGRLAEVLGERLVETDRFLRTIGLWRVAGESERTLDAGDRRALAAYAAGVNAWIGVHRGALPPEFVALRLRPEPWTVRHSLAIEKIMAWDLSAYDAGLELARAVRRLGPEKAGFLAPEYPDWGPTILGAPLPPEVPPTAAALLDALSVTRASNAWAIAGRHTRSGKPILANDMHLELRAPSLWYLAALHGGGLDVAGMTLPGAPFVVAGRNRAVAWGFTNAYVDDVDFFIERVDPADPARYLAPGGSLPFEAVAETIQVRGAAEPVVLPVRWTRNGPILTPVEGRAGDELIALRWVGHEPARTWRALLAMNAAAGWAEFVRAVEDFDNPHQNVVYADTAGHIGYYMGGRVPIRGDGKRPPLLPVPGWTGEWDWRGELPITEHPHVLDPPEGFVVTANNRQAAGRIADLISTRWEEPFRAMRIREMLLSGGDFDAAAVRRQQLDVRDLMAERYRDRAVDAAERAKLPAAAEALRGWDLEARADSRAAAVFYVWYERLRLLAARSLYGEAGDSGTGRAGWFPRDALHTVLERRALPWVQVGGDAAFADLAARAMVQADSMVRGRSWGELHRVSAEHALGQVAFLERSLNFNVGGVPHGGSTFTVNVSYAVGTEYPVRVRYGASQRHVSDMGDPEGTGGFILPTGQSGIPFSRHYRDQFDRWRQGGLWAIPLEREAARRRSVHRLTLKPEQRM